jgi:pyridinium-3,5-bisthiocarboxylic acid mononucleotide nickel chelatase
LATFYLDCFSGASGDMMLGALLDLGLPLDALRGALGSLAIEYGDVTAERVKRAGVTATKFRVLESGSTGSAEPPHRHHHLKHIVSAIHRSSLSADGKERAVALFERLAEAEAAIHDTPIERVHLHEVGALDSIIDIVGAVFALEWFGIDDVVASPLNVGGGTVQCAHGVFPVPAPATARLLARVPIYGNGTTELVTPTGALLVTGYARSFGPLPAMRVDAIGYGAGDRDPKDTPNVLRIFRGERIAEAAGARVVQIECEIDDMNPQLFGPLMDHLADAGALDVFYAAVQMKKNRPGTLVTVIAPPSRREAIAAVLFAHSTTIGVRYQEMQRDTLEREIRTVATPLGAIRFKVATRAGSVLNASPEFDDCARIAAERGMPIKEVQAIATRAWLESK